jgi:hypothetical protein
LRAISPKRRKDFLDSWNWEWKLQEFMARRARPEAGVYADMTGEAGNMRRVLLAARENGRPVGWQLLPEGLSHAAMLHWVTEACADLDGVTFLLGQEAYSSKILNALFAENYDFIMEAPASDFLPLEELRELFAEPAEQNLISGGSGDGDEPIFAVSMPRGWQGRDCYVHFYYNPARSAYTCLLCAREMTALAAMEAFNSVPDARLTKPLTHKELDWLGLDRSEAEESWAFVQFLAQILWNAIRRRKDASKTLRSMSVPEIIEGMEGLLEFRIDGLGCNLVFGHNSLTRAVQKAFVLNPKRATRDK